MPNLFDPQFDSSSDREGFSGRRAKLGEQAGARRHLGNEELLVVLAGRPSLRGLEGERELDEGEVVSLPVGEAGAHQVVNRGSEPVRVLIVSEMNAPDIVVRPESGKLSAFGRPPGASGGGQHWAFHVRDEKDLWDGEQPPPER